MNTKMISKLMALVGASLLLAACGGGGGGGSVYVPVPTNPGPVIEYPFETVYGEVCVGYEPTPGCTFNRDGSRVNVKQDPDYNLYGYQQNDLWQVTFDAYGNATVKDDLGHPMYTRSISDFGGWMQGTWIGVGDSGLLWENVANKTYLFGANGVLYHAYQDLSGNYTAINNKTAGQATDTSFAALNSDLNKRLVKLGAKKLMKDYGFSEKKATAVASALNVFKVNQTQRGFTTDKDMDKTFRGTFGVDFYSALSAVKDLQAGSTGKMRDLTDRSAAALGLRPDQAQKFVKGMYKKALAQWGLDADSIKW